MPSLLFRPETVIQHLAERILYTMRTDSRAGRHRTAGRGGANVKTRERKVTNGAKAGKM